MMVSMVERARSGDRRGVLELWHEATRKLALVLFPLAALLVVMARPLVELLFTERYRAAAPIFAVWSLMVVAAAFQTDGLLRVLAATRPLVGVNLARLAATALLTAAAAGSGSLEAVAGASVAGAFVAKAAALGVVRRRLGVERAEILPWRALGSIAGVAAAAVLPARLAASAVAEPLGSLAFGSAAYAAAFAGLLAAFDLLDPAERAALGGMLRRLRGPARAAADETPRGLGENPPERQGAKDGSRAAAVRRGLLDRREA
jgi:O-antigen/teichoic acid export membrane protein